MHVHLPLNDEPAPGSNPSDTENLPINIEKTFLDVKTKFRGAAIPIKGTYELKNEKGCQSNGL